MEMVKWEQVQLHLKLKGVKILLNATSLGCLLQAPINRADGLEDKCSGLMTILKREDVVTFEEILVS